MNNNYYETVSEAITDLKTRGYQVDFQLYTDEGCIACTRSSPHLPPEEFQIDEFHRFEGNSDPRDEMIVYAISSDIHQVKGIIVNAYGLYSDPNVYKIVKRLKLKE